MPSIEFNIEGRKYLLKSDESEEHLRDVAELVRRKVAFIKKSSPNVSIQKASMLAALDFASQTIHEKKKAIHYRTTILSKANQLLNKLEQEVDH